MTGKLTTVDLVDSIGIYAAQLRTKHNKPHKPKRRGNKNDAQKQLSN